jgi:hypothetical protein
MAGLCHGRWAVPGVASPTGTADHRAMPLDASAVARKLKLAAAVTPVILGGTEADRAALAAARGAPIADQLDGAHDWVLLFVENRAALEAELPTAAAALASPGTLWIAYPKGSSKRQTDLTRDQGWEVLRGTDLMWLSLVSIDQTWSAFSLRRYKPGEARQTFR